MDPLERKVAFAVAALLVPVVLVSVWPELAVGVFRAVRYRHLGRFVAVVALVAAARFLAARAPSWAEALVAGALAVGAGLASAALAGAAITGPLLEQCLFVGVEAMAATAGVRWGGRRSALAPAALDLPTPRKEAAR